MVISDELTTAEAPGRLDVLGGVADYSGSLVLQTPIEATTRVTLRSSGDDALHFSSEAAGEDVELPLSSLSECLKRSPESRRRWLGDREVPLFARYPFGCLLLLAETKEIRLSGGLRFEIKSTVPRSMGVSSSAALEVATLRALAERYGVSFVGTELARLAQRAENEVVGAPCGLMDQLAVAHGERGSLLPILCRPDQLEAPVHLPDGVIVVGWPSGVQHDIGASPYATARAATFMGFEMFRRVLDGDWSHPAEIPLEVLMSHEDRVAEQITGAEYATRFGEVPDPLSTLDPDRQYAPRACLRFPLRENARANRAVVQLRSDSAEDLILTDVGARMYESHEDYSSIGLGCPETDQMVDLVRGLGASRGFYGARVSGGGSGGTVVVLMRRGAVDALDRARVELGVPSAATTPFIFSSGARKGDG